MSLPRPVAAVVFDTDGLLFDSERLHAEAIASAAREVGCAMSHEVFLQLVGRSREANQRFLLEQFGADYPRPALIAAWGRHFRALAVGGPPLKAGVRELLDRLEQRGLPRAIATSSSHPTAHRNLEHHGLAKRFQAGVAHGDYASGKPSPDPFLVAAARLGVEAGHGHALEDSPSGVRAAAAAGMMTIMVPDLHAVARLL